MPPSGVSRGASMALVPGLYQCHAGGLAACSLLFQAGEAFLFFLFVLGDDLEVEQSFCGVRVDAVEHVLEHCEALLFVLHERVLLPVAHQTDTLFDLVDRREVVLPLRVDDVEHNVSLVRTQALLAGQFFLRSVVCRCDLPDGFLDLVRRHPLEIHPGILCWIYRIDTLDLGGIRIDIPLVRRVLDVEKTRRKVLQQVVRHTRFAEEVLAMLGLEHQLAAEALTERMLRNESLQLCGDLGVMPTIQVGVDPLLETLEAQLAQARDLVLREAVVRDIGERRPTPEREGGVKRHCGGVGVPGGAFAAALEDVEAAVMPANPVAPRRGDDAARVGAGTERLVKAAATAGVRRFVLPSVPVSPVDESIPPMRAKRRLEEQLARTPMETVAVRLPPFSDVWLALVGSSLPLRGAENATLARPSPFQSPAKGSQPEFAGPYWYTRSAAPGACWFRKKKTFVVGLYRPMVSA